MNCARTGWIRARRRWQWAPTAAAALEVGCCRGGGTARSRLPAGGLRRECKAREGLSARLWCRAGTLGVEEAGRRLTARKAQGSVIGMYGDVWSLGVQGPPDVQFRCYSEILA